jgi:hypothetical protein
MINIICGDIGSGKTTLLTYYLLSAMLDQERYRFMVREINKRSVNRAEPLPIPNHCVFANYDFTLRRFRTTAQVGYLINPFRIGFANPYVKTHYLPPYAVIGITEGQKYFDSHRGKDYPAWQSNYYEMHRHNHLDIYIDVQRYMLINANIREIAQFIEIESFEVTDKFIWRIRKFKSSYALERYHSSGDKDETTFTREIVICDFNVFDCFDSFLAASEFDKGHDKQDYDLLTECKMNMPENFYDKKIVSVKELDYALKKGADYGKD